MGEKIKMMTKITFKIWIQNTTMTTARIKNGSLRVGIVNLECYLIKYLPLKLLRPEFVLVEQEP